MELKEIKEKYLEKIDIGYSYRFAKEMERFHTNPVLGYRTAGSLAERNTGDLIAGEMRRIGLEEVTKDPFTLDTWTFERAVLTFRDRKGEEHQCELGGYQTQFDTHGQKDFELIWAGRGTEQELSQLAVKGKIVLIQIDQRNDWWINFPAYQAHLCGAVAVIAVQEKGYGEVHETALNTQNIAGPADAPVFSISQKDAELLRGEMKNGKIPVTFSAKSTVGFNGTSYNIVGKISGQKHDSMILLSAHYDSYFTGFQDDNCAVAMLLGMAKALIESGYQAQHDLVFCAFAAEEWGLSNTRYDWSTGAYHQIFYVRPEWRKKTLANFNFELPAYAHGEKNAVRCVYEYVPFLKWFSEQEGEKTEVHAPVQTWSDEFSVSLAGVPSLVNDFTRSAFMQTHYHSQFDNDDAYDPQVYLRHHRFYGDLLIQMDHISVPPLNFVLRLQAMRDSLSSSMVVPQLQTAIEAAKSAWEKTCFILREHRQSPALFQLLQEAFQLAQDAFVRLTWHDEVIFPHEYTAKNLKLLQQALLFLNEKKIEKAISLLCQVDTNRYTLFFDQRVCSYFVDYALYQPAERLAWGAGRLPGHVELFETLRSLQKKCSQENSDLWSEQEFLKQEIRRLERLQQELLQKENLALIQLTDIFHRILSL